MVFYFFWLSLYKAFACALPPDACKQLYFIFYTYPMIITLAWIFFPFPLFLKVIYVVQKSSADFFHLYFTFLISIPSIMVCFYRSIAGATLSKLVCSTPFYFCSIFFLRSRWGTVISRLLFPISNYVLNKSYHGFTFVSPLAFSIPNKRIVAYLFIAARWPIRWWSRAGHHNSQDSLNRFRKEKKARFTFGSGSRIRRLFSGSSSPAPSHQDESCKPKP